MPSISDASDKIQQRLADMLDQKLAIIYFGQRDFVDLLMRTVESPNLFWIMSDAMGTNTNGGIAWSSYDYSGMLIISPASIYISDLHDYFMRKCEMSRMPNATDDVSELLKQINDCAAFSNSQSGYLTSAIDAVYAVSSAFKNAHNILCPKRDLCPELLKLKNMEFLDYVQNTSVKYDSIPERYVPKEFINITREVSFDVNGDLHPDDNRALYYINIEDNKQFRKVSLEYIISFLLTNA